MTNAALCLTLENSSRTAAFAQRVAMVLCTGDTLLLQGDIGAGKSFFARAIIHALQDIPEDVPSPTFTLVQTYDTRAGEVWHADLYRLSDPSEAEELGLTEAFTNAICLIEWPDRLAGLTPFNSVTFAFRATEFEDQRHIKISGTSEELLRRVSKAI